MTHPFRTPEDYELFSTDSPKHSVFNHLEGFRATKNSRPPHPQLFVVSFGMKLNLQARCPTTRSQILEVFSKMFSVKVSSGPHLLKVIESIQPGENS